MSLPSFGTLSSEQGVGQEVPTPETPFRIAVLGDFSGRSNQGRIEMGEDLGRRRPRKVDRDSLDQVMSRLEPGLRLPAGPDGSIVELTFRKLDDFEPDALIGRVEIFTDCTGSDEKSALLDAILHDPAFQALEASWRGLDWLLQRTSKCQQVEFRLIDLAFDELVGDLTAAEELESTGLYQIMVDVPAARGDMDPWSLFVGNYLFDLSAAHADVLGRIARITRQSSAPFLAGVNPAVLDRKYKLDAEDAEAWAALRALPESAVLGLATPRFLLRPPYGSNTRSIDSFDYEEYDGRHDWDHYLWGHTALACAVMLAQGFDKDGWSFKPSAVIDLHSMPLHASVDADGDPRPVAAEAWLVREKTGWLTGLGLMPLLCVKGRDSLQLALIQSLAVPQGGPTSPLLGRWGQDGVVRLPRTGMSWPISVGVGMMSGIGAGKTTGELSEAAAIPVPAASGGAGEGESGGDAFGDGSGTDEMDSSGGGEVPADDGSGSTDWSTGEADSSSADDSSGFDESASTGLESGAEDYSFGTETGAEADSTGSDDAAGY
jgi:type VI secretion system protein ImpC